MSRCEEHEECQVTPIQARQCRIQARQVLARLWIARVLSHTALLGPSVPNLRGVRKTKARPMTWRTFCSTADFCACGVSLSRASVDLPALRGKDPACYYTECGDDSAGFNTSGSTVLLLDLRYFDAKHRLIANGVTFFSNSDQVGSSPFGLRIGSPESITLF